MKIIDNVNHRLGTDLKESVKKGSKISIAASSFSIYAYEALQKELDKIDELRFIFTSPLWLKQGYFFDSQFYYVRKCSSTCYPFLIFEKGSPEGNPVGGQKRTFAKFQ